MTVNNNSETSVKALRTQSFEAEDLHRDNWPIAAGMLPFPAVKDNGTTVYDLGPNEWYTSFQQVADAGFSAVEITDTWLRAGDLRPAELDWLADAARGARLEIPAVALIRRSILEKGQEAANLAYSHRSIDAAAALGAGVVSVGLHEPLLPEQRRALWFWTAEGAHNDPSDEGAWSAAVAGLQELGRHAADLGILLTLEMYEDTFLGTADSAVRLVEEVGMDNVGLNPDTGNFIRLHRPVEPWAELLHKVLPYTNYWHVKNYLRSEDPATGAYFTAPTSLELGLINYRKAIADAIGYGFRGVITCEHYGGDSLGVSATNQHYLRSILPARHTEKVSS